MTKTRVVDLDELYNFVVDGFCIWNKLMSQNSIWSSHILKFKIQIVQTKSDREMTKTKVVGLDELYNFAGDDLFIWNHLLSQNSIWSSYILKFKFWML